MHGCDIKKSWMPVKLSYWLSEVLASWSEPHKSDSNVCVVLSGFRSAVSLELNRLLKHGIFLFFFLTFPFAKGISEDNPFPKAILAYDSIQASWILLLDNWGIHVAVLPAFWVPAGRRCRWWKKLYSTTTAPQFCLCLMPESCQPNDMKEQKRCWTRTLLMATWVSPTHQAH